MRGHFQICGCLPISSSSSSRHVAAGQRSQAVRRVSFAGVPILPKAFNCSLLSRRPGCARSGHTPRSAVHFLAIRRLEGEPWGRRSPDRLRSTQPPSGREHLKAFRWAIGGTSSQMTFIPQSGPPGHPDSFLRPNDTQPCQEPATRIHAVALHSPIQAGEPRMKRRRQ
jgi:hypothetical protein